MDFGWNFQSMIITTFSIDSQHFIKLKILFIFYVFNFVEQFWALLLEWGITALIKLFIKGAEYHSMEFAHARNKHSHICSRMHTYSCSRMRKHVSLHRHASYYSGRSCRWASVSGCCHAGKPQWPQFSPPLQAAATDNGQQAYLQKEKRCSHCVCYRRLSYFHQTITLHAQNIIRDIVSVWANCQVNFEAFFKKDAKLSIGKDANTNVPSDVRGMCWALSIRKQGATVQSFVL